MVGRDHAIRLTILNPSDFPMRFSGVTKSCSCIDAKISALEIAAGEEMVVEFTASIPPNPGVAHASWAFNFSRASAGYQNMAIRVNYSLLGVMHIPQKRVVCQMPSNAQEGSFRVPLLVTSPITTDQLEFTVPESLPGTTVEVQSEGGNDFILFRVDGKKLSSRYVSGRVLCHAPQTSATTEIYVIVKSSETASIHPAVVRVQADPESEDSFGVAMVRTLPQADRASQKGPQLIVDVYYDNIALPVDLEHLSATTARAKFTITPEIAERMRDDSKPEVVWVVKSAAGTDELHLPLRWR